MMSDIPEITGTGAITIGAPRLEGYGTFTAYHELLLTLAGKLISESADDPLRYGTAMMVTKTALEVYTDQTFAAILASKDLGHLRPILNIRAYDLSIKETRTAYRTLTGDKEVPAWKTLEVGRKKRGAVTHSRTRADKDDAQLYLSAVKAHIADLAAKHPLNA